jgi:hypothetical protein
MPSADYYREQANVLLKMALAMEAHPDHAARLVARACVFLSLADQGERTGPQSTIDGFNADQTPKA